jgi:hypothetical protein
MRLPATAVLEMETIEGSEMSGPVAPGRQSSKEHAGHPHPGPAGSRFGNCVRNAVGGSLTEELPVAGAGYQPPAMDCRYHISFEPGGR